MQLIPNTMHTAFAAASQNVPKEKRTSQYAMVQSALGRKLGVSRRKVLWSVARERR